MDIKAYQIAEEARIFQAQKINYATNSSMVVALLVTGVVLLKVLGAEGGVYFYAGAGMAAAAAIPLGIMIAIAVNYCSKKGVLQKNPCKYYLDRLNFSEFATHFAEFANRIEETLLKGYGTIDIVLRVGGEIPDALSALSAQDRQMFDAFVTSQRWDTHIRKGDRWKEAEDLSQADQTLLIQKLNEPPIPFFKIAFLHARAHVGGGIKASMIPALFPLKFSEEVLKSMSYHDDTQLYNVGRHCAMALKHFASDLWPLMLQDTTKYENYRHPRILAAVLGGLNFAYKTESERNEIIKQCKNAWNELQQMNIAAEIRNTVFYISAYGLLEGDMKAIAKAFTPDSPPTLDQIPNSPERPPSTPVMGFSSAAVPIAQPSNEGAQRIASLPSSSAVIAIDFEARIKEFTEIIEDYYIQRKLDLESIRNLANSFVSASTFSSESAPSSVIFERDRSSHG